MSHALQFCSIIGNPSFYNEEFRNYSQENINKLKNLGVDTILINLAWSREWMDAVTLEEVAISKTYPLLSDPETVKKHRRSLKNRLDNVKKAGLKAIALFGMPRYNDFNSLPDSYLSLKGADGSTIDYTKQVICISSEEVLNLYKELLDDFLEHCPDLDGILFYTYDELAECCDEESDCPRCRGIALEKRLPSFLNKINQYILSLKKDLELWWEPWELTASQVYSCLENLDTGIGVCCHSTLYEVYMVNQPDLWLRNVGYLAKEQNRKLIVELFLTGSGEDLGAIAGYPSPHQIYGQIRSLDLLEGVQGIKEYYGCAVEYSGINEKVASKAVQSKNEYDEIINELLKEYSCDPKEQEKIRDFWEDAGKALTFFPWDLSWKMRMYNLPLYHSEEWGQTSFAEDMRTPWKTPSWMCNRRSFYLVSETADNFNSITEKDIRKRLGKSLNYAFKAVSAYESLDCMNKELSRACEAVQLFVIYTQFRLNYLNLSHWVGILLKGTESKAEVILKLHEVLDKELRNCGELIELLQTSEIPYYLDLEDVKMTYIKIKKCQENLNNPDQWLKEYKSLGLINNALDKPHQNFLN